MNERLQVVLYLISRTVLNWSPAFGIWSCHVSIAVDQGPQRFDMAVGSRNVDWSVEFAVREVNVGAKVQQQIDAWVMAIASSHHQRSLVVAVYPVQAPGDMLGQKMHRLLVILRRCKVQGCRT